MKKTLLLVIFIGSFTFSFGQQDLGDLMPQKTFDNISVERIGGDSLSTQFVIWVKDTVRTHRHERHSESLYILAGQAIFYMEDESFEVKDGDFISIPKKTWHAVKVTSKEPLKVISVQSPAFYGKDRTFKHKN